MLTRDTDYERDCPRCGAETRVKNGGLHRETPMRECVADGCPWWLYKGAW